MGVKQRMDLYAASKGWSLLWVIKKCGLSNSYFYNTKRPGPDVLKRISEEFPDLNISWLLLGEGEMLRDTKQVSQVCDSCETSYAHTLCATDFLANKIKIAKAAIDEVYGAGYADQNSAFVAEVLKAAAHFEMSKSVETLKEIIRQAEKAELKQLKDE